MGVLAQWAWKVQEASRRDESLPWMASASGLAILLLGFVLHGALVAQKGDLVPLFERPLADGDRNRVARVLEDEAAAYVFTAGNVLVARGQRARILARLSQNERAERDSLLGLFLADAGSVVRPADTVLDGVAASTVRPPAVPASGLRRATGGAGEALAVPEADAGDGGARPAWTIYNITCDDATGAEGLRRRAAGD